MRIFRNYNTLPKAFHQATIAIGNFDGVHLGHKSLIKKAHEISIHRKMPCAVLTFEPHPKSFFNVSQKPFRLTPFRVKLLEIEQLGLDAVIVIRFDKSLAQQRAEDFIYDVLVKGLRVGHVVVGYDFRFGYNREGNCDLLLNMGGKLGFGFTAVKPIINSKKIIYSSTSIRRSIAVGDLENAKFNLGRSFSIHGRVIHGEKLGRTLGFPTANIELKNCVKPKFGVYAVTLQVCNFHDDRVFQGVASVGNRPTVDGKNELLEVFIFDFNEDIYGKQVKISLIKFIRPEKKFDSLNNMVDEMKVDSETARKILSDTKA